MYIAVDVGGTNIRVASFISLSQPVLGKVIKIPMANDYSLDLSKIFKAVETLTNQVNLQGLGLGTAGTLNEKKTGIVSTSNFPDWDLRPLRDDLLKKFRCPVALGNDASAAALAEALYGKGQNRDFIFITWGTGIGGSAIRTSGGRPEIIPLEPGHFIIHPNGQPDTCGKRGCLEAYCGGKAFKTLYHKTARELDQKDWDKILDDFSLGLADILTAIPSNTIVFGGGVAVKQVRHLPRLLSLTKKRLISPPVPLEITLSRFGQNCGLYGALSLLLSPQ